MKIVKVLEGRSNKNGDNSIQSKSRDGEIAYFDTTVETSWDDLILKKSKFISDYL